MGSKKTVTEKTLAANRLNPKQSTGPRTERGKNNSKFNAVKAGLFARCVVIPVCDGEGCKKQFARLIRLCSRNINHKVRRRCSGSNRWRGHVEKTSSDSRGEGRFDQ